MHDTSPNTRARGAWVAPLLSTVITLPLGFFLTICVMLSPMECDPCDGARLERFTQSFNVASQVYMYGLLVPAALLLATWALPGWQRYTTPRTALALLAPFSVIFLYILFDTILESPTW